MQCLEQKSSGAAGICFGLQNEQEYYLLKWRRKADENRVAMQVVRKTAQNNEVLAQCELRWDSGSWHAIEIMLEHDGIAIAVDGATAMRVGVADKIIGGIGLWLSDELAYCFDNVHVRQSRTE